MIYLKSALIILRRILLMKAAKFFKYAAILIFIALIISFLFFRSKHNSPEQYESVTAGITRIEASSLIFLADALGTFRKNGLDVTLKVYPSGLKSVEGLLQNDNEIAVCADFVFVLKSFENDHLKFFGTVARSNNHEVIGRRDRGIRTPSDLKGKRIGLTLNTSGDFFLETFLSFVGIKFSEVTLVNFDPDKIPALLSKGIVDAACTWSPYVEESKNLLGAGAVSWAAQKGQDYYWLLVTTEQFLKKRPQAAKKYLAALLDAERFAEEEPGKAREIISRAMEVNPDFMKAAWQRSDFRVRLDQNILTLMDDEARWAIRRQKIRKARIPNFFQRVDFTLLETMKPDAVSIMH